MLDVKVFYIFARILNLFSFKLRRFRLFEVVYEMELWASEELDLNIEAKNAKKLRLNFKGYKTFKVPMVYSDYVSKNVLVIEWIDGFRIDDKEALKNSILLPKDVLKTSLEVFFLQVFRDGFFHADIHPGNMFITKKGLLMPVDFGIMGRLTKETRIYIADVFYYIALKDYTKAAEVHFKAGYVPSTQSLSLFSEALKQLGDKVHKIGDWNKVCFSDLLYDLLMTTKRFKMSLRPELLLFQKTLVVAEGIGRFLAPQENMWLLIKPTMEEWMLVNRGFSARFENMIIDIIKQNNIERV